GRRRVDAAAERVRHPAQLLRHERLLQDRVAASAELRAEVHPVEPELDRQLVMPSEVLVGDPALVLLRVLLPRDQLIVDEGAGTVLDRSVRVGQWIRHARDATAGRAATVSLLPTRGTRGGRDALRASRPSRRPAGGHGRALRRPGGRRRAPQRGSAAPSRLSPWPPASTSGARPRPAARPP